MSKFVRNEDAFTGLEAAIVLIAFVVVAAVFSYVMLGAGFFATQESQRTVHTGVAQATSNLEVAGPVVVTADSSAAELGAISFFLQLAAGGASVDMQKVTFTVSTAGDLQTYTYTDLETLDDDDKPTWYVNGIAQDPHNDMLDKFEAVKITIKTTTGEGVKALPAIDTNDRFIVEVKPDIGAALPINRIAPADFQSEHNYEVY